MFDALKKVGGLVWQSDDATPAKQVAQTSALVITPDTIASGQQAIHPSTTGGLDTDALEQMFHANIQASPSFSAAAGFLQVNESMANIIADEATRFKAAAAAYKTPAADLITSASSFEMTMASEAANFETNFVGSAEQDISATENELTQVEANIASLTEQLGQASTRKSELDSAVIAKKAELAKAKIDFASTSEKVRGFYTNLVSKMTKYIGA